MYNLIHVQISGDTASSTVNAGSLSDLSNIANTSLYGFEDYHGVDIGVVRAVRLWFSPLVGEIPIEIRIKDTDTRLGFAISRTEEVRKLCTTTENACLSLLPKTCTEKKLNEQGFIYISSVMEAEEDSPSARSGLRSLYKQASQSSRLLVVSRISNHKVLPWMVSSTGAIRCFDTVSLSQKLSLHRHARVPILVHVFLWDRSANNANVGSIRARAMSTETPLGMTTSSETAAVPLPTEEDSDEEEEEEDRASDAPDITLNRDTAGEFSFRLHDFALKNNWV